MDRKGETRSKIMRRATLAICIALLLTMGLACSSDRVEDTEGGVILSVTDFDGLPVQVSVNGNNILQMDSVQIQSFPKNANAPSSTLMDVEMRSYEVVYERVDGGVNNPAPMVRSIFGLVPVGGTTTYDNLVIMTASQLRNQPLSDLLIENGGVDRETNSQAITVNFRMRFFGRTIAGDDVATAPIRFDVEFVP